MLTMLMLVLVLVLMWVSEWVLEDDGLVDLAIVYSRIRDWDRQTERWIDKWIQDKVGGSCCRLGQWRDTVGDQGQVGLQSNHSTQYTS